MMNLEEKTHEKNHFVSKKLELFHRADDACGYFVRKIYMMQDLSV